MLLETTHHLTAQPEGAVGKPGSVWGPRWEGTPRSWGRQEALWVWKDLTECSSRVSLPGNPSPSQAESPASPAPASAGEVVWFASNCSAWAYSRAALILLFFSLLLVLNWEVHSRSPWMSNPLPHLTVPLLFHYFIQLFLPVVECVIISSRLSSCAFRDWGI